MHHSLLPLRLQGAPDGLEQLLGLVACSQIQTLSAGGLGLGGFGNGNQEAVGVCLCMSPNLGGTWKQVKGEHCLRLEQNKQITRQNNIQKWLLWRGLKKDTLGAFFIFHDLGGGFKRYRTSETILCLRVTAPTRCDQHDRWFQTFIIVNPTCGKDAI